MISRLLLAMKSALAAECADLALSCPEKGADGKDTARPPRVYIGDFPAKREGGQGVREMPCIVLSPLSGFAGEGQEFLDIVAHLCVYNNESGDAEGLEMELLLLQSAVSRFIGAALFTPLERRFLAVPDEKERIYRWQRNGDLETPRPFAQVALVSRWAVPGWQSGGPRTIHSFPPELPARRPHE